MRKIKKIFKLTLKSIVFVLLIMLAIITVSIPYGIYSEDEMKEVGMTYNKIVLKGVNILTMKTDSVLKNRNIYIENDNIVNITSDTVLIKGYKAIDVNGKFAMPGLIDMHAHVFDRTDLPQYLAHGVTTVRNMMGFPMHLRWKKQLKEGKIVGSHLITATPTLNYGENAGPFHKKINNAEEIKLAVEEYTDAGYDFVKVYDDIDSLQLKAIEDISKTKNTQVAGHPPKVSLERLLNSSLVSIEHAEELLKFLDEERSEDSMRALAKKLKASNKAVTLNLVAFNRIYKISHEGDTYYQNLKKAHLNPITKLIGSKQLEIYTQAGPKYKNLTQNKYQAMETLSRILAEEGVTVLLGTDSGPNFIAAGVSVLEEMQLLKAAGLSEHDILKSATYNAAEVLNKHEWGRVEANAIADLLILNENPLTHLETISKPYMLFFNNKYYSEVQLSKVKALGENKQNMYATMGLFLEHLINK
ncbi:MAG: amidohydrolase family protein [Algicola sp.]|nr:amidohydrolase family protein [Algicola sp.]